LINLVLPQEFCLKPILLGATLNPRDCAIKLACLPRQTVTT
jgi:hypothetical protein